MGGLHVDPAFASYFILSSPASSGQAHLFKQADPGQPLDRANLKNDPDSPTALPFPAGACVGRCRGGRLHQGRRAQAPPRSGVAHRTHNLHLHRGATLHCPPLEFAAALSARQQRLVGGMCSRPFLEGVTEIPAVLFGMDLKA
jgi:hypothetical protein